VGRTADARWGPLTLIAASTFIPVAGKMECSSGLRTPVLWRNPQALTGKGGCIHYREVRVQVLSVQSFLKVQNEFYSKACK
jgi:hypothetical protein